MSSSRRPIGRVALVAYRLFVRIRAKVFSMAIAGAFAQFGNRTVVQPPFRVSGEERISVGDDVFIGSDSWLLVLDSASTHTALRIGSGTKIVGHCVLSAARSVTIGRNVLIARNAYISDHRHAFQNSALPVLGQGVEEISPVVIGDGAWLGEGVVVGPGVRIGCGAVIGANAVVLDDVPDHSVAVGAPARVIRSFGPSGQ